MAEIESRRIFITYSDLMTCSQLIDARFAETAAECARTQVIRKLLATATGVEHALRAQSRYALVNHTGTRGTHDLTEASDTLFEAMFEYASLIREIGARYRTEDSVTDRILEMEAI